MSNAWSLFVIIGTLVSIVAMFWLIFWSSRQGPEPTADNNETGHSWDGLTERNEPLPRWWLWLFILTLIFSIVYLVLFPGLGSQQGMLGWSQESQYTAEIELAEARYAPLFARYAALPDGELITNADALAVGKSLYANYCSQCHGSLGRGAASFPNLTDNDWLYGGSLAAITTSIRQGRNGIMPPLGATFANDAEIDQMVTYVRTLSQGQDTGSPAHGKYVALCGVCHGQDGSGMTALGAPALNDDIWLYGSSPAAVRQSIVEGRNGQMPAHERLLGADRARLLAAYVYSLSRNDKLATANAQ